MKQRIVCLLFNKFILCWGNHLIITWSFIHHLNLNYVKNKTKFSLFHYNKRSRSYNQFLQRCTQKGKRFLFHLWASFRTDTSIGWFLSLTTLKLQVCLWACVLPLQGLCGFKVITLTCNSYRYFKNLGMTSVSVSDSNFTPFSS